MMKKIRVSAPILGAALFWLGTSVSFATLGSDDFQGANLGTLHNQNSGTGWSDPWITIPANSTAAAVVNLASPLIYAFPGDGTGGSGDFIVAGRGLSVTQNRNSLLTRTVGPIDANVVYVSVLWRIDAAPTFPDNNFFGFWFDNTKTGTHTANPGFGLKANGGDGSTQLDVFARLALNNEAYVPNSDLSGRIGETLFMVARLSKSLPGGPTAPYTSIRVWLNPGTEDETNLGFLDAVSVTGSTLTSFSEVGFRTVNLPSGFQISVGPVLTGPTWLSVFPTPGGPLAVDLESFDAVEVDGGFRLDWVTSAEIDNAGFNIYRERITPLGTTGLVRINTDLIPAQGTETSGASYSFVDLTPLGANEERRYVLEDVEFGGETAFHGPIVLGGLNTPNNNVGDWMLLAD